MALQVWVRVGSADERQDEAGLAHVHEHMLFKGTERRAVGEVASEIEAAGGEINAYTAYDQTVYHVVLASRYFERGLDVLGDVVTHSAFDAVELGRELEVILEEIKRSDDSAPRVASQTLFNTAYTSHPYKNPVIGTMASVRSLTRDKIVAFYRRWYVGRNIVVVACGDLDEADALDRIAATFGALPAGELGPPRPVEPPQEALRFASVASRFQQTHLNLAFRVPSVRHEHVPALDLLALILGQGESSRLNLAVKRDAALVNDVMAYAYTPRDPGLLLVSALPSPGKTQAAYRAVLDQCALLCERLCSREEIEKARGIIESQQVYERESVQGQARKLGFYETLAGGVEEEDVYYRRIQRVTPEDVRDVARLYFTPTNLSVASLLSSGEPQAMTAAAALEEAEAALRSPASTPRAQASSDQAVTEVLSGGARVIVLRDASLPLLALRAVALGGLGFEPAGRAGASRLMSSVLTRGTTTRSAAEIARTIEGVAGQLDAFAGRNSIGLRCELLSRNIDRGFDLFAETLLSPAFDAAEIERERGLHLEELRIQADRPAARTIRALTALLYGDHPYGLPTLGTHESVGATSREDLVQVHGACLHPGRLVVTAAGDVDVDRVLRTLDDAFRAAGDPPAPPVVAPVPVPSERRETRIDGDGAQAHIAIGFAGLPYASPARATLDVLLTALSGQGGRLFLELRDRRSLAYTVTASSFEGSDSGYFFVYMGTSPEKVVEGLAGLEAELLRLVEEPLGVAELERAKQYIVGSYDIGLQRRSARASLLAFNTLYGVSDLTLRRYADAVLSTTREDVRSLAARLIHPERASVSILQPRR